MISTPEHYRFSRVLGRLIAALPIVLAVVGLFCGTALFCSTAVAQPDPANPADWLQTPPKLDLAGQRSRVMQMAITGFRTPEDRALFEAYYKQYELKRWTVVADRANVAGYRSQLQIALRNFARKDEVHQALSALVLDFMTKLAADYSPKDFHPSSRVNAMLMIGELNEKEGPGPAKPLPAALPVLTRTVSDPAQLGPAATPVPTPGCKVKPPRFSASWQRSTTRGRRRSRWPGWCSTRSCPSRRDAWPPRRWEN